MKTNQLQDPSTSSQDQAAIAPDSPKRLTRALDRFNQPETPSDHSLIRNVAWTAASDWGTQIFSWLAFLQVMRLLSPADFGIAALANILMPYFGQLTGMGLPRSIFVFRDLTDDQLAQMNTLSLMSATSLFLIGVAIAKPFAAFFKTPALAPVFIVACSGLIMSALCGVPNAVLARELRFRMLSVLGIVCTLTAAAATLAMAWCGLRYWALLLGNMVSGIIRAVVILRARPCRLAWPRFESIRKPIRFGWQISISLVAMNSYQRLDNFVAGKFLGTTALGFYGTAWELANVPIEKIASLVTAVIPSYLIAVQDQPAALRRYLRVLTEVIAMGTFPATVGLSLVAREFVPLVFGPKWDGMIMPLQVLSFYAGFRSVMALLPKVLTVIGSVRYVMWNELAALILLPIAFYIGSYRGTAGIAWGWVVAYPFIVLPMYRKTFRAIGMTVSEYVGALRPGITGTITMIVAVVAVRSVLAPTRSLLLRLASEVAVGALVYCATLWLLHRDRVLVLIRTLRALWQQKTSGSPKVA